MPQHVGNICQIRACWYLYFCDSGNVKLLCNYPCGISARNQNVIISIQISSSACPANQVFRDCQPCNFHCKDLLTTKFCPAVCMPGCACQRDYYWNGTTCVPQNQCRTNGKFKTSEINICCSLTSTHEAVSLNVCFWGMLRDLIGRNISSCIKICIC